jgi:hypothetical protein
MNNQITIGMIGKAGSGKDTVADYIVRRYGFSKIALADPLKKAVQIIFDIDNETMYDREKREEPLVGWEGWTVRKLLQFVGTELFRVQVDENIWVKNCVSRSMKSPLSVIADVRFHNEVDGLKKYLAECGRKSLFIKVVRPDVGNGAPSGIANHASESAIDELKYDFLVVNDGSFEDLYQKVDVVMAMIDSCGSSQ